MRLYSAPVVESGASTGETWNIHDTRRAPTRIVAIILTSGTVTWHLEGRIGEGTATSPQTWDEIATGSATSTGPQVTMPQMRFRISAATSFIGHVDIDADGRKAEGFSADRTDS